MFVYDEGRLSPYLLNGDSASLDWEGEGVVGGIRVLRCFSFVSFVVVFFLYV